MDIIVRGEPHEIDFVRRLCRDKVRRGVLAILPAAPRPAAVTDDAAPLPQDTSPLPQDTSGEEPAKPASPPKRRRNRNTE